jgi:hypothetical protein
MKTHPLFLLCFALLPFHAENSQAEEIAVDFEGLSNAPEFKLTNQIPGIVFDGPIEGVTVVTPATIDSSPGISLPAVTSGKSAVLSWGARIRFSVPVVKVAMSLSPSRINLPLSMKASYGTAYLSGYRQDGTLLVRSETPLILAVARQEDLTNYTPSTISISAVTPISYVTIDLDDPFNFGGTAFFFDDLVLTLGKPVQSVHPTMYIERAVDGKAGINWGFFNCELQWTTNLASGEWQTIEATNARGLFIDTRDSAARYFRVKRLLPAD